MLIMIEHNASAGIEIKNLDLFYGKFQALKKINIIMKKNEVTSFIGPSGCGHSTCLRCIHRMNDLYDCRINGEILIDDKNIYAPFSINTPIIDILNNEYASKVLKKYLPQIYDEAIKKNNNIIINNIQNLNSFYGFNYTIKTIEKCNKALSNIRP